MGPHPTTADVTEADKKATCEWVESHRWIRFIPRRAAIESLAELVAAGRAAERDDCHAAVRALFAKRPEGIRDPQFAWSAAISAALGVISDRRPA